MTLQGKKVDFVFSAKSVSCDFYREKLQLLFSEEKKLNKKSECFDIIRKKF